MHVYYEIYKISLINLLDITKKNYYFKLYPFFIFQNFDFALRVIDVYFVRQAPLKEGPEAMMEVMKMTICINARVLWDIKDNFLINKIMIIAINTSKWTGLG